METTMEDGEGAAIGQRAADSYSIAPSTEVAETVQLATIAPGLMTQDGQNEVSVSGAIEPNHNGTTNDNAKVTAESAITSASATALTLAPPLGSSLPAGLSSVTTEILARMSVSSPAADYTVAREHILKSIVTSENLPSLPPTTTNDRGRGRPRLVVNGTDINGISSADAGIKTEASEMPLTAVAIAPSTATFKGSARGGKRKSVGRGRRGKKTGKRKRSDSEVSSLTDSETEALKHEHDANGTSEPKVTKSGRAVHRPAQFVPVVQPSPTIVSSATATGAQKKRKRIRRNPENAVCKSCERGHSPDNNAIVFCDGCGTPYHQYCHTPPIDKEYIEIAEKEWLCIDCGEVPVELPADFSRLIPGDNMSDEQKRAVFAQLSHAQLIDVLIHATSLQPSLAIFPPPITALNGVYYHLEPGAELPYDGYETDPPAHYPKPGNGLARTLPPESEHLDWLLDDNTEVFSHFVNDKPFRASNDVNGRR